MDLRILIKGFDQITAKALKAFRRQSLDWEGLIKSSHHGLWRVARSLEKHVHVLTDRGSQRGHLPRTRAREPGFPTANRLLRRINAGGQVSLLRVPGGLPQLGEQLTESFVTRRVTKFLCFHTCTSQKSLRRGPANEPAKEAAKWTVCML
jgi:hypothetical protein